jgi:hypothetical protein
MQELLKYMEGKSATAPTFKSFDHFAKAGRACVSAANSADTGMLRSALAYVMAEYGVRGGNAKPKDYAALSAKQVFGDAPTTKELKGEELAEAKREGARLRKRIQLISDLAEHHMAEFIAQTNTLPRDEAAFIQAALAFARHANMKAAINAKEAAKAKKKTEKALAKEQAESAALQNEAEKQEQAGFTKEATLAALFKAAESVIALAKAGDDDAKAALAGVVAVIGKASNEAQESAEETSDEPSAEAPANPSVIQAEAPAIQGTRQRRKAEAQAREAALQAQIDATPLTEEAA